MCDYVTRRSLVSPTLREGIRMAKVQFPPWNPTFRNERKTPTRKKADLLNPLHILVATNDQVPPLPPPIH